MTSEDPRAAEPPMSESAGRPGGSEPEAAGSQVPEPVQLLVQAIGTLPAEQRDQVYAWLLSREPVGQGLPMRLRETSSQLVLALQRAGAASSTTQMTAGQQVVPVRFPVDQHAQLRTWCAEHGFSMATVIRGLVSRFLDGQLPERN